jgi:DNA-binding NtrC family response regulator
VLAATNRDLRAAMRAATFREDLYYRLDGFRIRVPPLRARRDDIPLLARHFLDRHVRAGGRRIHEVDAAATERLLQHEWPGNVRELEHVIQRAAVLARRDVIDLAAVRGAMQVTGAFDLALESSDSAAIDKPQLPFAEARERAVDGFARAYLEDALRRSQGQIAQAARLAGLDKSNFRRLMRRHRVISRRTPSGWSR